VTYPEYPGDSGPSSWDRPQGWQPPTQPGPAGGPYPELPPYEPAFRPYTGAPSPHDYGAPQPFYIEPGQPYAAYTRPKRTSSVAVLLIVMPVVLILIAGVFVAGIISSRTSSTAATAASVQPASTVAPSVLPSASSTAKPRTGPDHFTAPTKVAGLPKSTAPTAKDLVKLMTDMLDQNGGKSVVAIYQDPADQSDILMLAGTPHLFSDPADEVSGAFATIAGNPQMTVGARTTYAAGPLGGTLMCASTTATDGSATVPIGVCMLADNGGLLKTLYFGHSGAAAAKILQSVRKSFER
jgi:hypothetical protein